jgi:DNA-binding FrmR family transcriptional regulator
LKAPRKFPSDGPVSVRVALRKVEDEILRDHVGHWVEGAIKSGNKAEQRRKVAELMDVFARAER